MPMSKAIHIFTLALYAIILIFSFSILLYTGFDYYRLPEASRYYHPAYDMLKPSGFIGHGLGIAGSLLITIGLVSYMIRKRVRYFYEWGKLKHWLEFHIFMSTWGTILVLFHTTFKFGGIISIGFWSLVLVWVSGVVGRFLYLQIPHSIEGQEMSANELRKHKGNLENELRAKYELNFSDIQATKFSQVRLKHLSGQVSETDIRKLKKLIRKIKLLDKRIYNLDKMKRLFTYWHVIHLPFALIMYIILAIHIAVVVVFGYKWIF